MCHFITAIIKQTTNLDELNFLGKNLGITFGDASNQHVELQLKHGQRYLWKNSKYCDCGTALGSIEFINQDKKSIEKELIRLKKKGWTETKIKKWISNKERSELKDQRTSEHKRGNYQTDAENWINFLKRIDESPDIEYFGLIYHWYSQSVENERLKLVQWKQLKINNLTPEDIFNLKEDTVYELNKNGA